MSRSHAIPGASVVFLLLFLCFTHSESALGGNCIFTHPPLPTTDASSTIEGLKRLLLLDYLVSLPSNLKPDEHCFALWQLHFISAELSRLSRIAGSELRGHIETLEVELSLKEMFENCTLESDCVEFERSNISTFLDSIPSIIQAGNDKMERMKTPLDFSNCIPVRCQSDPPRTPCPGYCEQLLGNTQASKSAILQRHHWLLIPIPLLVCLFSVVKFSGRVPFQPLPLQV